MKVVQRVYLKQPVTGWVRALKMGDFYITNNSSGWFDGQDKVFHALGSPKEMLPWFSTPLKELQRDEFWTWIKNKARAFHHWNICGGNKWMRKHGKTLSDIKSRAYKDFNQEDAVSRGMEILARREMEIKQTE